MRDNRDRGRGGFDGSKGGDDRNRNKSFLPSPEILESYNYVIEGSAERILRLIEKEQEHRQEWEKQSLTMYYRGRMYGQVFSMLIALFVIIYSGYMVFLGQKLEGMVTLLTSAVTFLLIFYMGSREGRKKYGEVREHKDRRFRKFDSKPGSSSNNQ